jgi:hypothetical protein
VVINQEETILAWICARRQHSMVIETAMSANNEVGRTKFMHELATYLALQSQALAAHRLLPDLDALRQQTPGNDGSNAGRADYADHTHSVMGGQRAALQHCIAPPILLHRAHGTLASFFKSNRILTSNPTGLTTALNNNNRTNEALPMACATSTCNR